MAKSYGVAGVVASFLTRRVSLRGRRLSSDEAELLEHYRDALSDRRDEDRVAVLNRAYTGMWW